MNVEALSGFTTALHPRLVAAGDVLLSTRAARPWPVSGREIRSCDAPLRATEREPEVRPRSLRRFHPEPPAVAVDRLARDRESDARARILVVGMEAAERTEDLGRAIGRDPDSL